MVNVLLDLNLSAYLTSIPLLLVGVYDTSALLCSTGSCSLQSSLLIEHL